jgi:hypothetical protein
MNPELPIGVIVLKDLIREVYDALEAETDGTEQAGRCRPDLPGETP